MGRSVDWMSDEAILEQLTVYHVMLYLSLQGDSTRLVPELYDCFGESMMKLIKVYGGQTIKIPTLGELKQAVADFEVIFDKVRSGHPWTKVAKKYNLANAEVLPIKNRFRHMCMNITGMVTGEDAILGFFEEGG
jgi:Mor family transcriptional regulator